MVWYNNIKWITTYIKINIKKGNVYRYQNKKTNGFAYPEIWQLDLFDLNAGTGEKKYERI